MKVENGDVFLAEHIQAVKPSTPLTPVEALPGVEADEQLGSRILHHEVQALLGIARVKGLVGTAGLQHTQRGNGHPLAARDEYRHHILQA